MRGDSHSQGGGRISGAVGRLSKGGGGGGGGGIAHSG